MWRPSLPMRRRITAAVAHLSSPPTETLPQTRTKESARRHSPSFKEAGSPEIASRMGLAVPSTTSTHLACERLYLTSARSSQVPGRGVLPRLGQDPAKTVTPAHKDRSTSGGPSLPARHVETVTELLVARIAPAWLTVKRARGTGPGLPVGSCAHRRQEAQPRSLAVITSNKVREKSRSRING